MIVVDKKGRWHWNIFWTQMRLVSSERAQAAINAQKRGSLTWQWVKFDTFLDLVSSNDAQALSGNVRNLLCWMLLWGQARQFKGHAPTSTHGELQKNPSKFSELGRLGAARICSELITWNLVSSKRAQVGSLRKWPPWNDGGLEKALFFPLGKIGKGIGLGELQKGPSFFFQKDPGMTKVEQYGERPFWLNAMRHWASFKSNTQTRKREWRAWL